MCAVFKKGMINSAFRYLLLQNTQSALYRKNQFKYLQTSARGANQKKIMRYLLWFFVLLLFYLM